MWDSQISTQARGEPVLRRTLEQQLPPEAGVNTVCGSLFAQAVTRTHDVGDLALSRLAWGRVRAQSATLSSLFTIAALVLFVLSTANHVSVTMRTTCMGTGRRVKHVFTTAGLRKETGMT